MKYHYYYRDSSNTLLDGWISAKNRDDAYSKLKAQGIKPSKVVGRNPLDLWKWVVIGLLVLICAWLLIILLSDRQEARIAVRNQLYGDPGTLKRLSADGWANTFASAGDVWFARHAIPANECGDEGVRVQLDTKLLKLNPDDPEELSKMKRMINWMKLELKEYINGGGSIEDYIVLCCERQAAERGLKATVQARLDVVKAEVKNGNMNLSAAIDAWEAQNQMLKAAGLPTVFFPEEWGDGL